MAYKLNFLDDPLKPPDTSKPVNGNEEFCCFFSNEFGYHSLLYAGEMDGFLSNETITEEFLLERDVKFVELKTGKLADGKSSYFFDLKLARAWCQSYLSCVEEVLYGFRTRNGIVTKIQRYTLNDIKEKTKVYSNDYNIKNFIYNVSFIFQLILLTILHFENYILMHAIIIFTENI